MEPGPLFIGNFGNILKQNSEKHFLSTSAFSTPFPELRVLPILPSNISGSAPVQLFTCTCSRDLS